MALKLAPIRTTYLAVLRRYAWGVLFVNLGVILWGAFVRATGSGAGCGSHWPTCNGEVVPRAASVETAIELTHRVTSGVALLLVLGLAVAAFRARPRRHPLRWAATLSLVFILTEAAIGAGIVLLEHVAMDQSVARVYWMGAHLTNTFVLVACLTASGWFADAGASVRSVRGRGHLLGPVALALLGTLLVGVTGAVTALGDTLFPAGSLEEGVAQDFAATAHFLVRLRVWHPVTAVAFGLVSCGAATYVGMRHRAPKTVRAAQLVVVLFAAQIAGGFLNLVLLAPVWMQLVHLLMADLTWMSLVALGLSVVDGEAAPAVDEARAADDEDAPVAAAG